MDLSPVVTLLCLCLNVAPSEPTVTYGSRVRFTFKASEAMWLEAGQDRIAAPLARLRGIRIRTPPRRAEPAP